MDQSARSTDLNDLLQHAGWIQGLAYATLRDHALAEDVSQEVLLKALQGPKRGGRVLRAWLAAVTRNEARNTLRAAKRKREREQRVAQQEGVHADPASSAEILQAHQALTRAIEGLATPHREILLMRFYREMSFRAIADDLGATEGTVRTRLHRALAALRQALQREGGDWRVSCIALVPWWKSSPWTPSLATHASRLGWMAGASILAVACFVWIMQPPSSPREDPIDPFVVALATLEMEEAQVAAMPHRSALEEADDSALGNSSMAASASGVRSRALLHGIPVPGASVSAFQDGQLHRITTDDAGLFQVPCDPDRVVGLTIVSEHGARSLELEMRYRSNIDLVDLHQARGILRLSDEGVDTPSEQVQAEVRIYVDWSAMAYLAPPREEFLELAFETSAPCPGEVEIPTWLAEVSTIVEVEAPGYLPYRQYFEGGQGGDGTIWAGLFPGEERELRLEDTDGHPLAECPVYLGFPCELAGVTDTEGHLPSMTSWGRGEDPNVANLFTGILLRLEDGRHWFSGNLTGPGDSVSIDFDTDVLVVDTKPIEVHLQDKPLGDGQSIQVMSMHSAFGRGLLRATGYTSTGLVGSSDFLGPLWQDIAPGETVELTGGIFGPGSAVFARLQPYGWSLGEFPIEENRALVQATLVEQAFSLEGVIPEDGVSYSIHLRQDRSLIEAQLPVEGGEAKVMIPAGIYTVEVWRSDAQGSHPLLLGNPRHPSFSRHGRLDGSRWILSTTAFDWLPTRILVDGQAALGGIVGGHRVDPDGRVLLPYTNEGEPFFQGMRLELPAAVHQATGGTVFLNHHGRQASPFGTHSIGMQGEHVLAFTLSPVELMVPASTAANPRNLSVFTHPLGETGTTHAMTDEPIFPPPKPNSWGRWGSFEVSNDDQVFRLRLPPGRYKVRLGDWGEVAATFGGDDGFEVLPGVLEVVYPD
ncbi:MAG: RNA polymerase sigma factor [Planctomycetota bacterium]